MEIRGGCGYGRIWIGRIGWIIDFQQRDGRWIELRASLFFMEPDLPGLWRGGDPVLAPLVDTYPSVDRVNVKQMEQDRSFSIP